MIRQLKLDLIFRYFLEEDVDCSNEIVDLYEMVLTNCFVPLTGVRMRLNQQFNIKTILYPLKSAIFMFLSNRHSLIFA